MAIIAHYLDASGVYRTRILALPRVKGKHRGVLLAPVIHKTIMHFGIESKIGFYQSDNHSANTRCIASLLRIMHPELSRARAEIVTIERRMRCICHIFNLIAKAILLGGKEKEGIDADADDDDEEEEEFEDLTEAEAADLTTWRKSGPVKQLQAIVIYVRASTQRRDTFERIVNGDLTEQEEAKFGRNWIDESSKGLSLKESNSTRWNSTFYMIERALRLQNAITNFCSIAISSGDMKPEMLIKDSVWAELSEIKGLLSPFKTLTKIFEGRDPKIYNVIYELYALRKYLTTKQRLYANSNNNGAAADPDRESGDEIEVAMPRGRPQRVVAMPRRFMGSQIEVILPGQRAAREPSPERSRSSSPVPGPSKFFPFIAKSIGDGLKKVNKYLVLLNQSPVYWGALVLHPGYRKLWITRNLGRHEVESIITKLRCLFDERYPAERSSVATPVSEDPIEAVDGEWNSRLPDDFYASQDNLSAADELDIYLSEMATPVEDPVDWWWQRRERFPRLSRMALDLLTIPPSSAECERCFSQAKLIITTQRHGMDDIALAKVQCMKNWLRNMGFEHI